VYAHVPPARCCDPTEGVWPFVNYLRARQRTLNDLRIAFAHSSFSAKGVPHATNKSAKRPL
jgi:hypothetical protein